MIAFITSSPFREDVDRPTFSNDNGFVDRIRAALPPCPRCLFVCSDPDAHHFTCRIGADVFMAFAGAGIHFAAYHVLDNTNAQRAGELVKDSDLIVLAGGHVPTQNAFFQKIGLRQLLNGHPGVVMGISAGSMNCAELVYSQPEEPGESAPEFVRFLPGLGLTDVQILPHLQKCRNMTVDGLRLYEDITFADSMGHTFYAIPDLSYVLSDGQRQWIFGEAYRIADGFMRQCNHHGQVLPLFE